MSVNLNGGMREWGALHAHKCNICIGVGSKAGDNRKPIVSNVRIFTSKKDCWVKLLFFHPITQIIVRAFRGWEGGKPVLFTVPRRNRG